MHVDRIPADKGTRTLPASNMSDSTWTKGPAFLLEGDKKNTSFDLEDPEMFKCFKTLAIS